MSLGLSLLICFGVVGLWVSIGIYVYELWRFKNGLAKRER